MTQKHPIDTDWFLEQLRKKGRNATHLASFLGLDKSAVSRMLSGKRPMKVHEQDKVARFLGVSLGEIARRAQQPTGFAESKQDEYLAETVPSADTKIGRQPKKNPYRHPAFGCMIGTLTIAPGVDLTEPMDFEWSGELYNE